MKKKGILPDSDERQLYELALTILDADQGDDENGVFDTARILIEGHLKPRDCVLSGGVRDVY
ncbi:hypothetical protein AB4Z52_22500 [Rhizobium sp. 2YAF20]|uniref:hypothetical protein n=1 Tax=Rhizobium sp. 2YAF20 TaxID=3233027 RepID=UPI003F95840B